GLPVVLDDENDVALPAFFLGGKLGEENAALPIRGDLEAETGLPIAFEKTLRSHGRIRLGFTGKRPQAEKAASPESLVITQAEKFDAKRRGRVGADHEVEVFPGLYADGRSVALD